MPDAWCSMLPRGRRLTVMRGFQRSYISQLCWRPKIEHFWAMLEARDLTFLSNAGDPRSYISEQCWRPKDWTSRNNVGGQDLALAFGLITMLETRDLRISTIDLAGTLSISALLVVATSSKICARTSGIFDQKRGAKMSYIDTRSEALARGNRYSGFNDQIGFRRFAVLN